MFVSPAAVQELRKRLKQLGQKIPDDRLLRLVRYMDSDADLVVTALLLSPRPEWLENIVGPKPG